MDLTFLSEADIVTVKMELARAALETAKNNFEIAKQAYEDLLAQSDAHGIPRAKLKKLTEDRVRALFESGVLNQQMVGEAKRERPRKANKKASEENTSATPLVAAESVDQASPESSNLN